MSKETVLFTNNFMARLQQDGIPVPDLLSILDQERIKGNRYKTLRTIRDWAGYNFHEITNGIVSETQIEVNRLKEVFKNLLTPWIQTETLCDLEPSFLVVELSRASNSDQYRGLSPEKILRLLSEKNFSIEINGFQFVPNIVTEVELPLQKLTRQAQHRIYQKGIGPIQRSRFQEEIFERLITLENHKRTRVKFKKKDLFEESRKEKIPTKIRRNRVSRKFRITTGRESNLPIITSEETIQFAEVFNEKGLCTVYQEYGGKVVSESPSFFEGARIINPSIFQTPEPDDSILNIMNHFKDKTRYEQLEAVLLSCNTALKTQRLLLEYGKTLSIRDLNLLINSILLWELGFKHIQKKRSDTILLPEKEFESILLFLKNAKQGKETVVSIYYALYKSGNPLRTGGQNKIDLGELEFFNSILYPCIIGKMLDFDIKWAIINEASESAYLEGFDSIVIEENEQILKNYLSLIKADTFIEIRSMRDDIRKFLGDYFESYYKESLDTMTFNLYRGKNFSLFFPPSFLRSSGIKEEIWNQVYAAAVSERIKKIPIEVLEIGLEQAKKFDALMSLRSQIRTFAQNYNLIPPIEFGDNVLEATIIRKQTKLVIDTLSDFFGSSRFPNYGIAVYKNGEYLGVVQIWEIIINPNLFEAYTANGQIIAFEFKEEKS